MSENAGSAKAADKKEQTAKKTQRLQRKVQEKLQNLL